MLLRALKDFSSNNAATMPSAVSGLIFVSFRYFAGIAARFAAGGRCRSGSNVLPHCCQRSNYTPIDCLNTDN
jgi:hypothetical protein